MTKAQLQNLLEKDGASVKFSVDDTEYGAEPVMVYEFNEATGLADFKVDGFILEKKGRRKSFKDFESFFEKFENKQVKLISINDEFESIESYEDEKAFDNINMEELLATFLPVADSFSLTCPFNSGYDEEHPFGLYRVDSYLAERALNELEEWEKKTAERQYGCIPEKDRKKLPAFEMLYEEVKAECRDYRKGHKAKADKFGGNVFFGDEFSKGNTKYKKPAELWHVYEAVDFVETCRYTLDKTAENEKERPLDEVLDKEEYAGLKSSLIKTEVGFTWHCTTSGMLSETFFFKLNETTAEWLKKFENDYALEGLEDLAFYKDGKLIFSSCTHEKFHTRLDK
ncbi:MAG TPA: hypothetical protein DD415_03155 [Clostridiales bacterium]|nr:hypothetical protein [Clostridiales bacterium]